MPDHQANDDGADPQWTISPDLLQQCLVFFQKHYNVISTIQLKQYTNTNKPLPPHALLISFDDGWRDNYVYGFPILKMLGLPAVVFIAGNRIGCEEPFWQEQIFATWKKGALSEVAIDHWLADIGKDSREGLQNEKKLKYLISCLSQDDPVSIIRSLKMRAEDFKWSNRQMLSEDEILEMHQSGVEIGAHGYSHRPMANLDPNELDNEFKNLAGAFDFLSKPSGEKVDTLSFPHGSYSGKVVKYACKSGYHFLFSSDSIINLLSDEKKTARIWGRIVIDSNSICKSGGKFCNVKMSRLMMFQPKRTITGDEAHP